MKFKKNIESNHEKISTDSKKIFNISIVSRLRCTFLSSAEFVYKGVLI